MRTTVDVDPRVLAAARARVSQGRNKSIGAALSELALAGMAAERPANAAIGGLVLLPAAPGHLVTDQMVRDALLDD